MIPHFVPEVHEEAVAAVLESLRARRLSSGTEVAALEKNISETYGGAHVICVASGTAALYLALTALGARAGNRVCIPSYTCNSLYVAAAHTGADVVLADCGVDRVLITPQTVEEAGAAQLAAVVVPHTCGFDADIDSFRSLGFPIIEDCAHAVGGMDSAGCLLGSRGDVAILSFYATKLLPAGEGGACITRSQRIADLIRRLRNCDEQEPDARAFNFKMSDLCAAVARMQWSHLAKHVAQRESIARSYDAILRERSFRRKAPARQSVCFRYLIEATPDAAGFIEAMEARGIVCRRPIYRPLHLSLGGRCPRADALHRVMVSIPCYPLLSEEDRRGVRNVLQQLV